MLKNFAFLFIALASGCVPTHAETTPSHCNENHNVPSADFANVIENDFGQPVLWNQEAFPIRVIVDYSMREKRKRVVQQAIATWNRETELNIFSYEESVPMETMEENTIWINEEPLPQNECGYQLFGLAHRYFRHDFFGIKMSIARSKIQLHVGIPDDRVLSTAIHEFGHALGLHHDREIQSVMYPHNNGRRGSITEEDIEHVRMMVLGPRPEPFIIFNL